jgi:hypothetical protein
MANTKITSRVIADNSVGIDALNVTDGTNNQVLTTDGAGTLSFSTVSGTTINNNADNRIITGSDTANTLEGEANLTYDGSTLDVTGAVNSTGEMRITNPSATSQLYLYGATGQKANIILNEYGVRAWHIGAGTYTSGKFSISDGSTERLNIDASGDVTMSSTGSVKIPSGTTAQRPSSPANGMIRYNTTLDVIEEYRNGAWEKLSSAFSGSGGIKTTSGSYTYHTFNSSGSITFTGSGAIDILVVAGGGGGGHNSNIRGAGGGAGGLIFITSYPVASTTYTVSVGSGGAEGASGTNSVFSYSGGTTLTALGGGAGGYDDSTDNGADGGSGGGNWYPGYAGASGIQPTNTNDGSNTYNSTGFGNDGGTSGATHPYGSGGGGAGAAGGNFNATGGPVGGAGKDMSATFGTSVGESGWFAGGGGAASYPPQGDVKYNGGQGGGGRGWNNGDEIEQNGTANTGGGGGAGGSGGSGIVILRYLT